MFFNIRCDLAGWINLPAPAWSAVGRGWVRPTSGNKVEDQERFFFRSSRRTNQFLTLHFSFFSHFATLCYFFFFFLTVTRLLLSLFLSPISHLLFSAYSKVLN